MRRPANMARYQVEMGLSKMKAGAEKQGIIQKRSKLEKVKKHQTKFYGYQ